MDARKATDGGFTYLGRVAPLSHEGSEPMLVTFRLLTPLSGELQSRLGAQLPLLAPRNELSTCLTREVVWTTTS